MRCLVFREAQRAELLPRCMFLVGLAPAEREEERSPFLGADRRGCDPLTVNARLLMQTARNGSRQGEVEPRRPCASAKSAAVRRLPQAEQTKPSGQRRLSKNAGQLASSENAF